MTFCLIFHAPQYGAYALLKALASLNIKDMNSRPGFGARAADEERLNYVQLWQYISLQIWSRAVAI